MLELGIRICELEKQNLRCHRDPVVLTEGLVKAAPTCRSSTLTWISLSRQEFISIVKSQLFTYRYILTGIETNVSSVTIHAVHKNLMIHKIWRAAMIDEPRNISIFGCINKISCLSFNQPAHIIYLRTNVKHIVATISTIPGKPIVCLLLA